MLILGLHIPLYIIILLLDQDYKVTITIVTL